MNQKNILKEFQNGLNELGLETMLRNDEDTLNQDILFVEHPDVGIHGDEVIAQYRFLPGIRVGIGEKENVDFMIEMSIPAEVEASCVPALTMGAVDANFIMPRGFFEVLPNGSGISYRYTMTLWDNENEKKVLDKIRFEASRSLLMCRIWMDKFIDLAEGRMTYSQLLDELDEYVSHGEMIMEQQLGDEERE